MPDAWKQWVGEVVNRDFPLNGYLGGSERSAVFLTERREGDRLLAAAIKLIPAISGKSELQLSRWRLAAALSHPHLIQLFEFGECELSNIPLLYVVMECADENLSQVLSTRALTADETRTMLGPLLDAVAYLHGLNLAHGHIKPTNIMANGDELKLSSDALSRAGEPVDDSVTRGAYDPPESAPGFIPIARTMSLAGDVWSLGMTVVEALTQRMPTPQVTGQGPLLPENLPEPFLDIARRCLLQNPESRCTISEIAARLQGGRTPVPARDLIHPTRPTVALPGTPAKRQRYILPILAGLLLAAVLAGSVWYRSHSQAPQVSVVTLPDSTVQPAPVPHAAPTLPPAPMPTAPQRTQNSATAAKLPASEGIQASAPETRSGAKSPAELSPEGRVLQQVLPEVPQSARDTIHGTIKVTIRVDVDSSGTVKSTELETSTASKYFARMAMQSAQRWRFAPSTTAEQGALSTWNLRFQFTRAGTTVIPTQGANP